MTPSGWELEADQRHRELIARELGIESSKGLSTPGIDEPLKEEDVELSDWKLKAYRSLAARANYLSLDRPDIQYSVKELCRSMSRPTEGSWRKLMRVGKYLVARPRLAMRHNWQEEQQVITTSSDANWAGCLHSTKSTSGGSILVGDHLIKTWSKTQTNIALSSTESEFYSTLKAAQESIGIISLAEDFNKTMTARLQVDASAALGVAQRMGIGKIRHLQTGALWLQQQQLRNIVQLSKIPGADNTSDLMTKNVAREVLERHVTSMSGRFAVGRAGNAIERNVIKRKIRQQSAELRMLRSKNSVENQSIKGEVKLLTLTTLSAW